MLKLVGTNNQMHSRSLTFGFSGLRFDVDPFVAIFQRRITMLRRFLAKNPHKSVLVDSIYDAYARKSFVGTLHKDVDLSQLAPAPLPGDCGRAAWKSSETPSGAIGLLLQNTHLLGAAIDVKRHVIVAHNRADVNYMDMPFQLLHSTICEFAFDQVHVASSQQRTILHNLPQVDTDTRSAGQ